MIEGQFYKSSRKERREGRVATILGKSSKMKNGLEINKNFQAMIEDDLGFIEYLNMLYK